MINDTLILFDIDGTLVTGARCHYQAFVAALKKYYAIEEDISGINYAGKTDQQILKEALILTGFKEDEIKEKFQECLDFMVNYYLKNVDNEDVKALTGTRELLEKLGKENILLGLVTGNLEPIAYAKLRRAGLDSYFSFGGFGSDNSDRSMLVKKALKLAQNQFSFHGNRIFIIGDTPRDIEAAKASNIPTIAVATGKYSREELESHGAEYVLDNLENKDEILEIIEKY